MKARSSPESDTYSPERIALLTPGGPLLVDVRLMIDGRPHTEVFESYLDRLSSAGDTDGDGKATWREFMSNRKYLEEALPNAPSVGSRQMKLLIERYDENRDGRMQRGEATSWLGRDAGLSASAFSVRSSRSYRPIPHVTSHIWQLLESDKNGRLSAAEIRRAPEALWSFDADDDRVISPSELLSLREQLEAAGPRRMTAGYAAKHYAAIHLEPRVDVNRLDYLLTDLYATRQVLEPGSFRDLAGLFHQLDTSRDGSLQHDELAQLLTMVEPHLELSVRFGPQPSPGAAAATLELHRRTPEITSVAQPAPDRLILSLGDTRLVVSAHDLAPRQSADQDGKLAAERAQLRLMIHDQCDALFEALDEHSDGKLGEREIAMSSSRILEWDANHDGQLASGELPYCMVVAFLRSERPVEQSFYVPTSMSAISLGVEAPSWFLHADLNGDGDVSRREFLGSREHFSTLDTNEDGYIDAVEAAALRTN